MSDEPTVLNSQDNLTTTLNFGRVKPTPTLTIAPSGIQINMETGHVTIPKELTLDAASHAFWQAIFEYFPREKRSFCGPEVTKPEGLE